MALTARLGRPSFAMAQAPPLMAWLLASVAEPVNTTSAALAPIAWAMASRARSRRLRAARPSRCTLEGFPKSVSARRAMAARALGLSGEVAL